MALQDYAQLKGFYNDSPITQVTSLEVVTEAGNQRVELLEGLGGYTHAGGTVTINVGFVVPIGGQEFNFQQDCANHAFVKLQIFIGRNSYAGLGKIDSVNISQSVGAVAEGSFTWTGELKPFE